MRRWNCWLGREWIFKKKYNGNAGMADVCAYWSKSLGNRDSNSIHWTFRIVSN